MNSDAYFYFSDYYKNCHEEIVCVNSKTEVVYISPALSETYSIKECESFTLSCIMSGKNSNAVRDAVIQSKYCSIDAFDIDNNPCTFMVFPTEIKGNLYASVFVMHTSFSSLEHKKQTMYELGINELRSSVSNTVTDMINEIRSSLNIRNNRILDNKIVKQFLAIRNKVENLATIASKSNGTHENIIIEVGSYIKRFVSVTEEYFPESRVKFTLYLDPGVHMITVNCKNVNRLFANIFASCIDGTKGQANIIIKTTPYENGTVIVFSDCAENCAEIEDRLYTSDKNICTDNSVIAKIVADEYGKICSVKNQSGGYSYALLLKNSEKREVIFRTNDHKENIENDLVSTLGEVYASLVGNETDFMNIYF